MTLELWLRLGLVIGSQFGTRLILWLIDMRGADRRARLNFKTDLIKHNIYNSNTSIIVDRARTKTGSFVVRSWPPTDDVLYISIDDVISCKARIPYTR